MYKGGFDIVALSIKDLSFSYPGTDGTPVLNGISLHIAAGEFVSVVGASGCGKSTLFKLISGLLEPDSGEIMLSGIPGGTARLGKVAYMPQQDLLLPWRTVLQNCMLPQEIKRRRNRGEMAAVRELLSRAGLEGRENAYPDQLSGGMKQRAAFVRTLACGGDLLLLDEPFGALDALTKREMQQWLLELWGGLGRSALFITHDLEEAALLGDRVLLMGGGSVLSIDVPFARPRQNGLQYNQQFTEFRRELERCLHELASA